MIHACTHKKTNKLLSATIGEPNFKLSPYGTEREGKTEREGGDKGEERREAGGEGERERHEMVKIPTLPLVVNQASWTWSRWVTL